MSKIEKNDIADYFYEKAEKVFSSFLKSSF